MKAMILRSYGDGSEFRPTQMPRPSAEPGHVLVRVAATSVNTVDTMIRQMGEELHCRRSCRPCSAWTSRAPSRRRARA